jgi:hypothetical protein
MKSFKQYLLEDPIMHTGGGGRIDYLSKLYPSTSGKLIGKIGSYQLINPNREHRAYPKLGQRWLYHLVHDKKIVGIFPIDDWKGGVEIFNPVIHKTHAGKRAQVENLVPKVYGLIADKLNRKIFSGEDQTRGSRSVWRRLAGIRPVLMDYDGKVEPYVPEKHERRAYSWRETPHGYSHNELTRFILPPKPKKPKRKL